MRSKTLLLLSLLVSSATHAETLAEEKAIWHFDGDPRWLHQLASPWLIRFPGKPEGWLVATPDAKRKHPKTDRLVVGRFSAAWTGGKIMTYDVNVQNNGTVFAGVARNLGEWENVRVLGTLAPAVMQWLKTTLATVTTAASRRGKAFRCEGTARHRGYNKQVVVVGPEPKKFTYYQSIEDGLKMNPACAVSVGEPRTPATNVLALTEALLEAYLRP